MTDDELLGALHSFGIDESSREVLVLLPVVWVAWADGTIHDDEREMIANLASSNIRLGAEGRRVLDNWLAWAPGRDRVERAAAVLVGLAARSRLPEGADVVDFCRKVAESAGPFLGKVSAPEREAIEAIAQSLAVEPHAAWEKVQSRMVVESVASMEDHWFDDEVTNPGLPRVTGPSRSEPERPVPGRTGAAGLAWLIGTDENVRPLESTLRIGRGRENDLQMAHDGEMSRHHCVIERREGGVYVRDLGAMNGTLVDGERVSERRLFGGEVIVLGETALRWRA